MPAKLLSEADAKLDQFFEYQPIRDRIPSDLRIKVLQKIEGVEVGERSLVSTDDTSFKVYEQSLYSLDEPLISQVLILLFVIFAYLVFPGSSSHGFNSIRG